MNAKSSQPNSVLTRYLELRDERVRLKVEFELKDSDLLKEMKTLEEELSKILERVGVDSIDTKTHSVSSLQVTNYWVNDWSQFHQFVLKNELMELMERRISKASIDRYLNDPLNKRPDGLASETKQVLCVTTLNTRFG